MFVATLGLLAVTLGGAAFRIRRVIDPACPGCSERAWKHSPAALLCGACGWSNLPAPESQAEERRAA